MIEFSGDLAKLIEVLNVFAEICSICRKLCQTENHTTSIAHEITKMLKKYRWTNV